MSQLKDTVHSNMNRNLPPYLVPDSSALLETMHLIKQLVYSSKFIIIIPLCGKYGAGRILVREEIRILCQLSAVSFSI